jgi:hypothetical protein
METAIRAANAKAGWGVQAINLPRSYGRVKAKAQAKLERASGLSFCQLKSSILYRRASGEGNKIDILL